MTVNLSRIVVLCLLLAVLIVPVVAFEHQTATEQAIISSEPPVGAKVVITSHGKEIWRTNEGHLELKVGTENGQEVLKVRDGKGTITIIPIPNKK